MKYALSAFGSIFTALACTACCWLPAVLGATAASAFSFLHRWQPYLLTFTALQLGVGFYLAYRPNKNHVCTGSCHHVDLAMKRKVNIAVMWVVAAFVVVLNLWNLRAHSLEHVDAVKTRSIARLVLLPPKNRQNYRLELSGLHCGSCAKKVKKALSEVKGVLSVQVNFEQGNATVSADPSTLNLEDLKQAVSSAGYSATSIVDQDHK